MNHRQADYQRIRQCFPIPQPTSYFVNEIWSALIRPVFISALHRAPTLNPLTPSGTTTLLIEASIRLKRKSVARHQR